MIIKSYDLDIPSIYIYHSADTDIDEFKEVLWGIEEEEIPYIVKQMEFDDCETLSHEASLKSRLSIGIGINKEKIILTTNKLKKDKPLFCIDFNQGLKAFRNLGANGARLVKGIELKKI